MGHDLRPWNEIGMHSNSGLMSPSGAQAFLQSRQSDAFSLFKGNSNPERSKIPKICSDLFCGCSGRKVGISRTLVAEEPHFFTSVVFFPLFAASVCQQIRCTELQCQCQHVFLELTSVRLDGH